MNEPIFGAILLVLSGFFLAGVVFVVIDLVRGRSTDSKGEAKPEIQILTLPCPACRDENDEPTGVITPAGPGIEEQAAISTESGLPPSFECATCEGTKEVHYRYRSGHPPRVNERQMIVSPIPGQSQK